MRQIRTLCLLGLLALLAACASVRDLPVHTGTIITSAPTQRKLFTPSAKGAAVGAAAGGLAGNQIGKGNGRKAATVLGLLAGAAAGAAAGGESTMVPVSLVTFRDDATGETFRGAVDGAWPVGMRVRFSVTEKGEIVVR
jgi:outer membrane lipoprotein SlyB